MKELGVKQESYWMWVARSDFENPMLWHRGDVDLGKVPFWASAFTVAELGEVLPEKVKYGTKDGEVAFYRQKLFDDEPGAEIFYADAFDEKLKMPKDQGMRGMTEADARAKMLIYLIEKKFVDIFASK